MYIMCWKANKLPVSGRSIQLSKNIIYRQPIKYMRSPAQHVLETCTGIHDDDTTQINTNDIFDSNPTNLKTTAKQLTKILEKLKN